MKSAECFYRTRNTRIQYIGDKCRVSVRFSVVGVHCHPLVLLPLAVTEHISGIVQAKTESEAKAILKNWIHKARAEEVMDDMIEGMRKVMRVDVLWWLEELQKPKRYVSVLSGKGKDLTIDVQIETLENITKIATTALVDSGCTSSAINWAFVKKHNIPTHATAAPIPVYNADRTHNQGGSITQYAEI